MTPYYHDDWVTIYHGDCADFDKTADALVTDPPWGLGKLSGTITKQRNKNAYFSFDDTEENVRRKVIPAICRVLERGNGRGLVTCGVPMMWAYPRPRAVGGFYQPAAVGMSPWGFAGYNPVLFYGKGPRDGKGQTSVMTTLTAQPGHHDHPCPKPLEAMLWMVNKATLEGETVLDPFMGSGTTLRAAKDLNRKAIGIEIEEKYCEIAANRMNQEVLAF